MSESSGSSSGSGGSSSSPTGGYELVPGISSGCMCAGCMQLGSNDAESGAPGLYLEGAESSGDSNEARIHWGPVTGGGDLDSGTPDVVFEADLAGGTDALNLTVGADGDPSVGGELVSSGGVAMIQIAASVSTSNARISWIGITVRFSNSDGDSQSIALPEEVTPVASTWGGSGSSNQQVVQITPDQDNYTYVSVIAEIQLETSGTTLPAADSMVAQVLVFASE